MNQKYSVTIYPNGLDKAGVELLFDSPDEHREYVKQESMHCRKAHSEYLAELYSQEERMKKKTAFYKMRVEFAKKNGFASVNASQWKRKKTKNSNNTPLGVA